MARTIDLNADLGEGFPRDEALLGRVSSASLACGGHAGDAATMRRAVGLARGRGVVVGAHPGFDDRAGFGRVEQDPGPGAIRALVARQVDALGAIGAELGVPVRFVKPHGALYNQAQRDEGIARPILEALRGRGLPVLGLPGGLVERLAPEYGVAFVGEGFADRRYRPDGRLVLRTEADAILHDPDEVRAQVLALVDRGVRTLCIHGDDPRSLGLVELVIATLDGAGIAREGFA